MSTYTANCMCGAISVEVVGRTGCDGDLSLQVLSRLIGQPG